MKGDAIDPKGLIQEAYRMEGITDAECRSIFVDWALSLSDVETEAALTALLERHEAADHPMTAILKEGLLTPAPQGRRGGRKARMRPQ